MRQETKELEERLRTSEDAARAAERVYNDKVREASKLYGQLVGNEGAATRKAHYIGALQEYLHLSNVAYKAAVALPLNHPFNT